jgi:2-amino-4-hydroxy-6-hydroxymethyldihydropteridine diphosphokinase
VKAFLALGSNLGDRRLCLQQTMAKLECDFTLLAHSSLYQSAPIGPLDQPDYLNAVCLIEDAPAPLDLLDWLQSLEHEMGRQPRGHWRERELDLDILMMWDTSGAEIIHQNQRLQLPHPRLEERAFVLMPLLELSPELCSSHTGNPLALRLSACLKHQSIRHLSEDKKWYQPTCVPLPSKV